MGYFGGNLLLVLLSIGTQAYEAFVGLSSQISRAISVPSLRSLLTAKTALWPTASTHISPPLSTLPAWLFLKPSKPLARRACCLRKISMRSMSKLEAG